MRQASLPIADELAWLCAAVWWAKRSAPARKARPASRSFPSLTPARPNRPPPIRATPPPSTGPSAVSARTLLILALAGLEPGLSACKLDLSCSG